MRKKYYSLIRGFPSMVQSVGIAQALAFVMAKAGDTEGEAHRRLRDQLSKWLFCPDCPIPWTTQPSEYEDDASCGLMRRLLAEQDPEVWWYAEEEAIAFSIWLKRFAEAITPAEERQQAE